MDVSLTFLGAAGEVTGSCYLVQAGSLTLLVDCGSFQGDKHDDERNVVPPEIIPSELDAIIVTHAHLDHTGRLPLLFQAGFKGYVYCTEPTRDLMGLILRDALRLQGEDIARTNKRRKRDGIPSLPFPPSVDIVDTILSRCKTSPYGETFAVRPKGANETPYLTVSFVDAGHILGSASCLLTLSDGSRSKKIAFSGDLGQPSMPILRDATPLPQANVVCMESTYGDRNHRSFADTLEEFKSVVQASIDAKGKLLIPVFAVGRAQLILYLLAHGIIDGTFPQVPIYVDSPMAVEASAIFARYTEFFDEEYHAFRKKHSHSRKLSSITPIVTREQSKQLNDVVGPCIILAGSGMCTGGRIVHHLRHSLGSPDCHVMIVGFQAVGSLGRALVDKHPIVTIERDHIRVNATIHTVGGLSAHAGQHDLLEWLRPLTSSHPQVFLTHGEPEARIALKQRIDAFGAFKVVLPTYKQKVLFALK
jgi:metallo-beta-lactamase family protein